MALPEITIGEKRPIPKAAQRHIDFLDTQRSGFERVAKSIRMGILQVIFGRSVKKELDQLQVDLTTEIKDLSVGHHEMYPSDGIVRDGSKQMVVTRANRGEDGEFTLLTMSDVKAELGSKMLNGQILTLDKDGEICDATGPILTKLEFATQMFSSLSQGEAIFTALPKDPGTL